jgi:predicted acylesterase/phospholipase RssA
VANTPTHDMWDSSKPCRISVALSGGGHRASAWGLGALYGLLKLRDAEGAKPDGVPIEVTAVASVSGGSLTNGVVATALHDRGVGLGDVALDDFRALTADLVATVATKGLIPAKGRTGRYVAVLVVALTAAVSALVAMTVAIFTAARGTPGFVVLLPVWLGAGAVLGLAVAAKFRKWWLFVAVLVVATAGALTWGFLGDTHGDAAWIAVALLVLAVVLFTVIVVALVSRRGRVLERALDRYHFAGTQLADVHATDTRHVFCATELQSGHQAFLSPELVTEWDSGEGAPGHIKLSTAVRASAALPLGFPPVDLELGALGVQLARPWQPGGDPAVPVPRLVLADGGVYDNMGDEWEYGYPERAKASALLPPDGAANFLLVANAGKDIGWQTFRRAGLLVRELRGLSRDLDVVYDVSTSQRRRTLLRLFREAEDAGVGLVGVIAHVPTSPLDVCAAFNGDPVRGPRAVETRIALNNMHEHWTDMATRNGNVPTTLGAISTERTIELILQAATLVTVSGYVVHGLGEAQPPTREEIRAWVERG